MFPFSSMQLAGSGDPYWSQVNLLMHFDTSPGPWVDSSSFARTVTQTTPVQSTTHSKFGGGAAGPNFLVSVPHPAMSGDFTVEAWFNMLNGNSGTQPIVIAGAGSGPNDYSFQIVSGQVDWYSPGGPGHIGYPSGPTIAGGVDAWHFASVSRQSGVTYVHVDGTLVGSAADAASYNISAAAVKIGQTSPGSPYIDDLRITIGKGRYGSGNYVVPGAAFPSNG